MQQTVLIILAIEIMLLSSCDRTERQIDSHYSNKPNIILILTDDQGIGDFGFNGNPYIKTPALDQLAKESILLTDFYVSPVCAPTRSSLMTGKYSERTGVYDTYNGGATMATEEVTVAEILKKNDYKTGIFGKWHLGDNYPYRPIDQGFDESLIHRAGGIGQPGDFVNFRTQDSSYFNPVLFSNEKPVKTKGYCTDVFTDGAIDFINSSEGNSPFFLYLAYNAPHTPLQIPKEYYDIYKDLTFEPDSFVYKDEIVTSMNESNIESAKRVYGMVTNIDDNIERLIDVLRAKNKLENTVIIFLTDNGPQQDRYRMGLRGRKASVYQGGVKVPCIIHYPSLFENAKKVNTPLAHIDLLPTILDICGIKDPLTSQIDGKSFFPLLMNNDDLQFGQRVLFEEWIRGFPVKYKNASARQGNYKLVGNVEGHGELNDFELYNLKDDPTERNNVVTYEPTIASALFGKLDDWLNGIYTEKNNHRSYPAYIGTPYENPVYLNRNDVKGEAAWKQEELHGYWDVKVTENARYNIHVEFMNEIVEAGKLRVKMYPMHFIKKVSNYPFITADLDNIQLVEGEYRLVVYFETVGGRKIFPFYVSFFKHDNSN